MNTVKGSIVKAVAGREKNGFFVVLDCDSVFAYIIILKAQGYCVFTSVFRCFLHNAYGNAGQLGLESKITEGTGIFVFLSYPRNHYKLSGFINLPCHNTWNPSYNVAYHAGGFLH